MFYIFHIYFSAVLLSLVVFDFHQNRQKRRCWPKISHHNSCESLGNNLTWGDDVFRTSRAVQKECKIRKAWKLLENAHLNFEFEMFFLKKSASMQPRTSPEERHSSFCTVAGRASCLQLTRILGPCTKNWKEQWKTCLYDLRLVTRAKIPENSNQERPSLRRGK